MGIAIEVCTDLSGDQVTQYPDANTTMLTAIAGGEHPSPTSRGVLFTQTAKTAQTSSPLLVSSALGADTIDSYLRAMLFRTTERQECDVRGWFSRKVNCHA